MTRILVRNVYDKTVKGMYINVTTSGGPNGSLFSPMRLGPVRVYQGLGMNSFAKNVENAWQFSKVYPEHDNNGEPTEEWYDWRDKGFNDSWAHRYPMGKGAIPLYSWVGKPIDYIKARKMIYTACYTTAVYNHISEVFIRLVDLVKEYEQITFLDYDVYPGTTGDDLTFEEIINNPSIKMGHAYVLANMVKQALMREG
jgi:hypothetical protein